MWLHQPQALRRNARGAEYLDAVYLQQDAFDPVDGASSAERQRHVFGLVVRVLSADIDFESKDAARAFFQSLTQTTKDWNRSAMPSDEFGVVEARLETMMAEVTAHA